jgi:uncharacterized membrane protein
VKHSHFTQQLDEPRILAAIAAAEAKTTGHIRALVSKRRCADPLAAARKHFHALGLHKDPQRNGVLIFVAPKSHTFAIYGDKAVHERCGDEFWNTLRDEMLEHLRGVRYTEALVHGISKAGDLLAAHFPVANTSTG